MLNSMKFAMRRRRFSLHGAPYSSPYSALMTPGSASVKKRSSSACRAASDSPCVSPTR